MPIDDVTSSAATPPSRHRRRDVVIGALGLLVVVLLVVGVTAARKGPSSTATPAAAVTTPADPRTSQPAAFVVTGIEPNRTAPPSPPVVDAVVTQLNTWANAGLLDPLRAGTVAPPLADLFTEAARPAAATTERPTLFAIGFPRSTVIIDAATAHLHAVAGPDAGTAVVVADVDLRLVAEAGAQRLAITRRGEIVFVPEPDGVWRIDGWQLHAAEEPL